MPISQLETMPLLEVTNLNSGYGRKQVLFDVSFEVNEGEVLLMVGPNGSGKSTILKAVYGLLSMFQGPDNGPAEKLSRISFNGRDLTRRTTSERLSLGL